MADYIFHHGIKGMHWGVRRDKTSGSAGSRRGGKTVAQKRAENQKRKDLKNRGVMKLDELRKKVERLKLEKELKDLTEDQIYPGRRAATEALKQIGTKAAVTILTGAVLYGAKAAVSKQFNPKELGSAIFNGGPKKK